MLRAEGFQLRFFPPRFLRLSAVAVGIAACFASQAAAQDPVPIVKVEEDWELQIGTPDPDSAGPQIINVISPGDGTTGTHAVFELNHQTFPDFASGGMQFQHWNGGNLIDFRTGPKFGLLSTVDEVVTYTLAMELSDSNLEFEVRNGTSTSWGAFGGQGYLKLNINTSLDSLNTYSSADSLKYSRVAFSANRVKSFVLKEVRYYGPDGELIESQSGDSFADDEIEDSDAE